MKVWWGYIGHIILFWWLLDLFASLQEWLVARRSLCTSKVKGILRCLLFALAQNLAQRKTGMQVAKNRRPIKLPCLMPVRIFDSTFNSSCGGLIDGSCLLWLLLWLLLFCSLLKCGATCCLRYGWLLSRVSSHFCFYSVTSHEEHLHEQCALKPDCVLLLGYTGFLFLCN